MKQVVTIKGVPNIIEVPSPTLEEGCILVNTAFSCISIGTEMHGMKISSLPLWKRAASNPEKALRFAKKSLSNGLFKTVDLVSDKLSSPTAVGYSSSGIVVGVGKNVDGFELGDKVACAGSQGAFHAEQVKVSQNLAVKMPPNVDFKDASTVALGAIALQGVRRLNPKIGESVSVLGLGIIGQITIQILKASGCKVIAIDIDESRLNLAKTLGADCILNPDTDNDNASTKLITDNYGVDAVIVTASSPSDLIIASAFNMCRKKGKIILVGDVGLNLNRADFYAKELDFLISSSYGPGRYDNKYEDDNIDYPLPFVRWTENRNMAEFLRLVSQSAINIRLLISDIYKIEDSKKAYQNIENKKSQLLAVLIEYNQIKNNIDKIILNPSCKNTRNAKVNISIAGAGSFTRGVHLPNLKELNSLYNLKGIMNRSGHNAQAVMKQYKAAFCTTSFNELIKDSSSNTILISTRHNRHSEMTLSALKSGKNVFVEKPLCLKEDELAEIVKFYENPKDSLPILMVGYNRRFSPHAKKIKSITEKSNNPFIINYSINAGYVPKESWIQGEEGGGRNLGEACHIYDLFNYLIASDYIDISVQNVSFNNKHFTSSDNFCVSIKYKNGCIANLMYTSMGSSLSQKETMSVFVDGKTIILNDYLELNIYDNRAETFKIAQDKGHKRELEIFADGIINGYWPISFNDLVQASKISFDVENLLNKDEI